MAAGILPICFVNAAGVSMFVVCVAIVLSGLSPFVEEVEQSLPHALGSLLAILAHPDEARPVPWPQNRKKYHPGHVELPIRPNKPVEIRQPFAETVADALDRIKRNPAHQRQPRNRRRLHVHQVSIVSRSQPLLLHLVSDDGARDQPALTRSSLAAEALPGAHINHARSVESRAHV